MNVQENRTKIIDEANKAIEHAEFVRKIEDNRQELFEEFYTIMKDYGLSIVCKPIKLTWNFAIEPWNNDAITKICQYSKDGYATYIEALYYGIEKAKELISNAKKTKENNNEETPLIKINGQD